MICQKFVNSDLGHGFGIKIERRDPWHRNVGNDI
jgi:hypothetical protein